MLTALFQNLTGGTTAMQLFNLFLVTMKKLVILLAFFTCTLAVQAQKVYFVYLQSDSGSPFFVKMGEKVQSSAPSGYIILSNLVDSTYTFSVGFPDKTGETKFAISINKEDKGYLLKTFDSGLGLFDLQSLTITKAITATKEPAPIDAAIIAAADPFTRLLAQASDDPNIYLSGPNPTVQKEQVMIAKEEAKPELKKDTQIAVVLPAANTSLAVVAITTEESPKRTDTATTVAETSPEEKPVKTPPVAEAAPEKIEEVYQRSVVTRRSESSTTEGFGLVFLDTQSDVVDTIRLLIPNPKVVARLEEPQPVKEETPVVIVQEEKKDTIIKINDIAVVKGNSCKEVATEKEFLKLRKNMAAADDEPGMLSIARKGFSKMCFSTGQVRNLSALFLTAIGKYNFFEAAYTHVSDTDQFAQLETELKDETYNKRFKALVVR
jgi:hypothetical protein